MNELTPTGKYNEKEITKFFNKQVRGAMKFGATLDQAKKQAESLVRIYKHNFEIKVPVLC